MLKGYTKEDVSLHNTLTDCWISYDNNVYDISNWIKKHPGGQYTLLFCFK
jgi:cytochrome b involved in lipid metabolism